MEEEYLYLELDQALVILKEVWKIKSENPNFKYELADLFENKVVDYIAKSVRVPNVIYKLVPSMNKIKVDTSLYKYLYNLTGVDPLLVEKSINKKVKKA